MKKCLLLLILALMICHADNLRLASESYQNGDYETSLQHYEAELELTPFSSAILFNMGNCHLQLGNANRAILSWQRATMEKPDFFAAYYNIATVSYEKGDYPTALTATEQALILEPDHVNLLSLRSMLYTSLDENEGALVSLENAHELDSTTHSRLFNLAVGNLEFGDTTAAMNYLKMYPDSGSENSRKQYNIGLLYESLEDYEKALSHFRYSALLDSSNKWSFYKQVRCMIALGYLHLAREEATQYLLENNFNELELLVRSIQF